MPTAKDALIHGSMADMSAVRNGTAVQPGEILIMYNRAALTATDTANPPRRPASVVRRLFVVGLVMIPSVRWDRFSGRSTGANPPLCRIQPTALCGRRPGSLDPGGATGHAVGPGGMCAGCEPDHGMRFLVVSRSVPRT